MVTVCVLLLAETVTPVPPVIFNGIEKFTAETEPESVLILSKALVGGMFRYGPSAKAETGNITRKMNNPNKTRFFTIYK